MVFAAAVTGGLLSACVPIIRVSVENVELKFLKLVRWRVALSVLLRGIALRSRLCGRRAGRIVYRLRVKLSGEAPLLKLCMPSAS
jgi:hypothetical protein